MKLRWLVQKILQMNTKIVCALNSSTYLNCFEKKCLSNSSLPPVGLDIYVLDYRHRILSQVVLYRYYIK